MSKYLDNLYEKVPASYWAIIGGIFGLVVISIASLLHSLTEPISFFTHFVSHLGWGPNGSEPIFRIGIAALGILMAPYILYLNRLLKVEKGEDHYLIRKIIHILAFVNAIISLIGLWMVSIWGNINQEGFFLHLVGAVVFFIMAMGFILFYTILMIFNKKWSKIQFVCTLTIIFFGIAMMVSALPLINSLDLESLTGSTNEMLVTILPYTTWLTFFEWLYILDICVWFLISGLFTLKTERELEKY